METITRLQAFEIFADHILEIQEAAEVNMKHDLASIKTPNLATAPSYNHYWVQANLYALQKENITKKYTPTIRATIIRQQPKTENTIEQLDVERAKEYPLADLLNTQGKKGNVSCPFHQDRKPSFQITKKNTFTCHSCGEYGDSIDLYQKLHNVDFLAAVKALT